MSKIILIGAIREGKIPNCGETMKNQLFVKRFKELFDEVITVDTLEWQKRPWVLLQIIWVLITNQNAGVVLSASASVRHLIHFLYYIPIHRKVYLWVVGEGLAEGIDRGRYKTKALRKMKKILIQGESMVRELEKRGITNARYVPNSKPIIFHPTICPKHDNTWRFVFLSRVHPEKGIKEIAAATTLLQEKGYTNFTVDFYGNIAPIYKEEYTVLMQENEALEYKGFLNLLDSKAYDRLSQYDVMLFPTYWRGEAFPGVVLDANMAGLPIIASDWNQNKYVVKHGKTGIIIPPHDAEALAGAMEDFINGKYNLVQMKRDCTLYVKQYDYTKVLSEELFQELGLL